MKRNRYFIENYVDLLRSMNATRRRVNQGLNPVAAAASVMVDAMTNHNPDLLPSQPEIVDEPQIDPSAICFPTSFVALKQHRPPAGFICFSLESIKSQLLF